MTRFLVLAALSLVGSGAPAQDPAPPASAVVEGRVLGPDRAPVPGALVQIRSGGAMLAVTAVTDGDGRFQIAGIPAPGAYDLVCSRGDRQEKGIPVMVERGAEVVKVELGLRLSMSEEVSVTAESWTVPIDVPNSTASRTVEQLSEQNLVNPEDAIRYVPNTTIRKRYIGDRNGLLGGRSFGTLQPSRGLVYLDGYLLSNFLGRFDAPRWNMVTPAALERVDVLYGPFSAIHAGNSIGTTIVMKERTPSSLEWNVALTGHGHHFSQYGETHDYRGGQASAYLGARFGQHFWSALTFNHQDATSQPMQYFNVTANAAGAFPAVSGAATPVSGIQYDTDPRDLRRALFGASAGAIDHTIQDSLKARLGYDISSTLEASVLVAGWRNDTSNRNTTFLRDGGGNAIWQGRVTDGVNVFNFPATALAPSVRDEKHLQLGATVRSRRSSGWNGSLIGSFYEIVDDASRRATNPDPVAANGGPGTVTRRDGTGWNTLEGQATYAPPGDGRHALTFGLHRNAYSLDNTVNDASDWRSAEDALAQRYRGESEVLAFYAQDAWRLSRDLKLTLGWRAERFRTKGGEQLARVATCRESGGAVCVPNGSGAFNKTVAYDSRTLSGHSPKASLAWTGSDHVILRASFGRGVRFPNVEELYNGTVTATSVTLSDPNLQAERSNAVDVSAEAFWGGHSFRASVFHDAVTEAILRQSNNTVTPSITNVSNVDLVWTSGFELVWTGRDVGVRGLSIEANLAFADSKVKENEKDPRSVGKYFLRVPKTRGSLLVAYRPNPRWMGSLGFRHQGRAYNDVYNLDLNPDVYGGVSRLNQLDLRVSFKPRPRIELATGMDNVTNQRAYQSHPYPNRTIFVEVRSSSR